MPSFRKSVRRRRALLGAAGLILIMLIVAAFLRRRPLLDGVGSEVRSAERQGSVLASAAALRAAQGSRQPPRASAPAPTPGVASAPTPTTAPPALSGIGSATAADYRRRARYPRSSVPIDDGQDPILRDREVSPHVVRGPGGDEPALVAFPEQVSFERPDPVVLYAYLSVEGAAVPARSIDGAVLDPHGVTVARLLYHDDGRDGDTLAGDAVYTVRVTLEEIPERHLQGSYLVRVHAVTINGEERLGSTGFLYSNPDAQLTGRYTDAADSGNLEIQAQVEVTAAGRFHLEATLYTPDGRPLVWAQNAAQLTPGVHWMPLSFFGLALRERGADGPYVLRFVALTTATDMPNAKNRLVENAYVTGAYAVTAFSDQPFNDPDLLEAAARLEAGEGRMP